MSHATIALILIHIDAHQGEWCAINWLAGRTLTPLHKLGPLCQQLVAEGQLQHAVVAGVDCYGVGVEQPQAQP